MLHRVGLATRHASKGRGAVTARPLFPVLAVLGVASALAYQHEPTRRVCTVAWGLLPMAVEYQLVEFTGGDYEKYHERWKDRPVEIALELRGFYVKMGQVISNQPSLLPAPYCSSLKILQEDVPAEKFSRIKEIVEEELGRNIEEVFEKFEEEPIGAASIGQVHCAKLVTGEEVVVKVQYPEAERFFAIDFRVMLFLVDLMNPQLKDVLTAQQAIFNGEFDYTQEGRNLRTVCSEGGGKDFNFGNGRTKVAFPAPFEELTTRKVLVMTKCEGLTITKIGRKLLEDVAGREGKSADEFVKEMKAKLKKFSAEDGKGDKVASRAVNGLSRIEFAMLRGGVMSKDYLANGGRALYNWTAGWFGARKEYKWSFVPPDGPRLMELLWAEKAWEIFELGAFNADPHAGNIMLDVSTDVVTMLDYGQLIRVTPEYREAFARYVVAIDEGDRAEVLKQWKLLGNDWTWKVTGEVNPVDETYACALFHFGGNAGMKEGMRILKFESLADVMDDFYKKRELRKIDIKKTCPTYGMLQRTCFCLSGVGFQVGTGQQSSAKMLRPSAERYLRRLNNKKSGK